MRGFLAHHRTHGRHCFVDELYVAPKSRGQRVATSLLASLTGGPIELIVARRNAAATALYASLGFCLCDSCHYQPHADGMCMRTRNYLNTRKLAAKRGGHATRTYTWATLPPPLRDGMVEALRAEWGWSAAQARRRLHPHDANMRYVVVP